jgi:hypothetical protein
MKFSNLGHMNDRRNNKSLGNYQQPHHCELCNIEIPGKIFRDVRSNSALRGKGKNLCSKCFGVLLNMPAEQALEALLKAVENNSNK